MLDSFFSKILSKLTSAINAHSPSVNNQIATATDSTANENIGFAQDGVFQGSTYQLSAHGIQMICNFEGCRLDAYQDSANVWTIGYGTTIYPDGKRVSSGDQCSLQQAQSYMQLDLKRFVRAVNENVKVQLSQNQFDALVSLCYNIGISAFKNSTLLKYLNSNDYHAASKQFDVWIKAGGRTVQGLINRRAMEKSVFLRNG